MTTLESCQTQQKQTPASKRQCHLWKSGNNKVMMFSKTSLFMVASIKTPLPKNRYLLCSSVPSGFKSFWRCSSGVWGSDALPSLYVRSRKVQPLSSARHLGFLQQESLPPRYSQTFLRGFFSLYISLCLTRRVSHHIKLAISGRLQERVCLQ